MLAEKIAAVRQKNKLTQEEIAEKLGISRQSVQKWESGLSYPSIDKLVSLSKLLNVSIDYLCKDENYVDSDAGRVGGELRPQYKSIHEWELYSKTLPIEYRQCIDEGLDAEAYKDLFFAAAKMPDGEEKEKVSDVIFNITQNAKIRSGYKYDEPNSLAEIRAKRDGFKPCFSKKPSKSHIIAQKILGGWYGRICGCLLGKPIEGITISELETLLKATGNYPISRYIFDEDLPENVSELIRFPIKGRAYSKTLGKTPADDDTNYMIVAYEVLSRYGRDFTSSDVADVWLNTQVKNAYCTAERVAFINLVNGYAPPASAKYKNAYREWIGAQIRSDVYGYVNPFDMEKAAEFAYRDATISHVKNGIYGSMWVAAMTAAAFGTSDVKEIILCGLSQIPSSSRLYEKIKEAIVRFESGMSLKDYINDFHERYDETLTHDWCHTISNAEIVAVSLLYGAGNYRKAVCTAVSFGFDTDCNGATVGSIMGVALGYDKIPADFTSKTGDTLETNVFGRETVSIKQMAKDTENFLPR